MTNLLLHSMAEFAELIIPSLELAEAKIILEIGSEYGLMTKKLIAFTENKKGQLITIDPSPSPEAENLFGQHDHARLIKDLSLNVIDNISADACLVDGDHNYYTVSKELEMVWKKSRMENKEFLVFLHDVGWPWARRDLYYAPDQIPPEYLHPHVWDRGITLGNPSVINGGFRGEGVFACAVTEGGGRNGVLTAIEDFVCDKPGKFLWAYIPAVFGMGVLFEKKATWADQLSEFLSPYHENTLLAKLEKNRLECYLKIIEWQDRNNGNDY